MRAGAEAWLPVVIVDRETNRKASTHTLENVYREMLFTICMNYTALPDPRFLTLSQVRFFYSGLRPILRRSGKQ